MTLPSNAPNQNQPAQAGADLSARMPAAASAAKAGLSFGGFLETWGGVIALFLMIGYMAMSKDSRAVFFKPENIRNVFANNSYIGIIAVGMTFVIISGGIDLSVGSMLALIGVISIWAANYGSAHFPSPWEALAFAYAIPLIAGTIFGWINGILITKGRIAPFIVTLGGLAGFRSIALALTQGGSPSLAYAPDGNLTRAGQLFTYLGDVTSGIRVPFVHLPPVPPGRPLMITWPIIFLIIIFIFGWILLVKTRFGRYCIAIGSNEAASRYAAINIDRVKIITYTFIGLCTGIAGLLTASRLHSVDSSSTGSFMELDAIAAVVIGGTRLSGGKGRVWGTIIGALILGLIDNILNINDVSNYWQGLVKGIVIIAAVLLQRSD